MAEGHDGNPSRSFEEEEEARPLVGPAAGGCRDGDSARTRRGRPPGASHGQCASDDGTQRRRGLASHQGLRRGLALVLLLFAGAMAVRLLVLPSESFAGNAEKKSSRADEANVAGATRETVPEDPDRPVPRLIDPSLAEPIPRTYKSLRHEFQLAKDSYIERLRREYGSEYYGSIFAHENISVGRLALRSASLDPGINPYGSPTSSSNIADMGPSWDRLKRKILVKLLEAQIGLSTRRASRREKKMPTFVLANAGMSSAAGHGNLYNESYSAVLERAVRPALQRLGVWFEARNYAMGSGLSAPEMALCSVPIYGTDVDAIIWNFAQTDGREVSSMEMFLRQASMAPGRPSLIALDIGGALKPRRAILHHLENSGVAALYMPPSAVSAAQGGIPDSFGMTEAELESMPPLVQSFKCEGALEKGEPGCGRAKWNYACPRAKYRTGWHPGMKWHALIGNLLGLSLLEAVDDALAEMEKLDFSRGAFSALQELRRLEDLEYEAFYKSEPTGYNDKMIKEGAENLEGLNLTSLLYTRRWYCHTARLPSEARFRGILTESSQVGFFHYDKGVSKRQAQREDDNRTRIRLAYEDGARQECPLLLNVDYKDFFYLVEPEGTKSLVLPNDAEIAAYGAGQTLAGIIGFTLAECDWGKCPKGDLRDSHLETGEWEMYVNGIPVTGRVKIKPTGHAVFVRHEDGWHFPPNDEGRFEIQVRVKAAGMSLRFSSFMIY